jgi:hypothetical protein
MPDLDQLRFMPQEHAHGFTSLGQLAGATLTEYLRDPPAVPRLHLGLNTLPDPPLPIAAHVPLDIPEDEWRRSGEDLLAFLDGVVTWRSNQQPSRHSALGPATRTLQPLLRLDSIVLAWKASMIVAADGDASLILVRELMNDGQTFVTDLDPAAVRPALAAWAVDRGGFSVFAWARTDVGGAVSVGDEVLDPDDEVFRLLAATLAAQ